MHLSIINVVSSTFNFFLCLTSINVSSSYDLILCLIYVIVSCALDFVFTPTPMSVFCI